jgi:hypothetical protein
MQTGCEQGHALQTRTSAPKGDGGTVLCDDLTMTRSYLVARLHVDLQRVSSAVCSAL